MLDVAGQSCEADTDFGIITLLLLLRVVAVALNHCLGCCCYVVAGAIVAADQSCEWWSIDDAADFDVYLCPSLIFLS
jgi:hypothetical protein